MSSPGSNMASLNWGVSAIVSSAGSNMASLSWGVSVIVSPPGSNMASLSCGVSVIVSPPGSNMASLSWGVSVIVSFPGSNMASLSWGVSAIVSSPGSNMASLSWGVSAIMSSPGSNMASLSWGSNMTSWDDVVSAIQLSLLKVTREISHYIKLTSVQTIMKNVLGLLSEEKTETSSDFRENDTLSRRYKHTRPSHRRSSGKTPESNRATPLIVRYVSIPDVSEVFTKKTRERPSFFGKTKVSTPCIVSYVSIPNPPDRPKDRVPSHELSKGSATNHLTHHVLFKISPKTSILLNKPENKKISEENLQPVSESFVVIKNSVYKSVAGKQSRGIPYYASFVSLPKLSEENIQPVSESLMLIEASVYESVSRKRSRGIPYYASFTSLPKISVSADDLDKKKLDYVSLENISFLSSTSLPDEEILEKTISKDLKPRLTLSEPSLPNESMQKAVNNYDVKTEVIRQRTVDGSDTSTEPVEPRNEGWDTHPVLVNKISSSSTSLLEEEILEKTNSKDLRSHSTLSGPSMPNESIQKAVKNYDVKTEVIRQRIVDGSDTSTEPAEPRNEGWDTHPVFPSKISSSRHKIITEKDAKKIRRLIYGIHRDLSYFYHSDDSSTSSMVPAPDDTTERAAIPPGNTLKEGVGKVELDQNAKENLTIDESPEKLKSFPASMELTKEPSLSNVKLSEIPIVYHDAKKKYEMKQVFSKMEKEGCKTSFSESMPTSAIDIEPSQEPPLEAVQEFFEHILVDHAVKAERTSAAIERLLDKLEKEDVETESNESTASRTSTSEPSEESSLDVIDEFVKGDTIHPRVKEEHTNVATPRLIFELKKVPFETEQYSNKINHEASRKIVSESTGRFTTE
uniref:Uncharacterized protein n=1 Tax=Timema bartmani TaxID=61472 RepID=A0A7R9F709_9NEOP|nr:unnamed protein product [Timema bartmani]